MRRRSADVSMSIRHVIVPPAMSRARTAFPTTTCHPARSEAKSKDLSHCLCNVVVLASDVRAAQLLRLHRLEQHTVHVVHWCDERSALPNSAAPRSAAVVLHSAI